MLSVEQLDKDFNVDNFRIIKGGDGNEYLAVISHMYDGFFYKNDDSLYIYNDKLRLITGNFRCSDNMPIYTPNTTYEVEGNPWFKDEFNAIEDPLRGGTQIFVKIDGNEIHYLMPISDDDPGEGILEERVYTIVDNMFQYKVVNSYKITGIVGSTC